MQQATITSPLAASIDALLFIARTLFRYWNSRFYRTIIQSISFAIAPSGNEKRDRQDPLFTSNAMEEIPALKNEPKDNLPDFVEKEAETIVIAEKVDYDFMLPADFSEHAYRLEYTLRSAASGKVENLTYILMMILLGSIEFKVITKYGLDYALEPKRLFTLLFVFAVFTALFAFLKYVGKANNHCNFLITDGGIKFSDAWRFELHKRYFRPWNDIHSVQMEENIYHNKWVGPMFQKRSSVEQLKWSKDGRLDTNLMLQFDYKSGGNASIVLSRLNREQCRCLFLGLENYVDQSKLSRETIKLKHAIIAETTNESFTDIWMEDLEQRYAITNFVPLSSGHRLRDGAFQVLSILSTRGQTAVYLGRDTAGKNVVLKELNANFATSDSAMTKAREMFDRETAILSKLNHPDIANVIDSFIENNRVYLVLEYIPGSTLRQEVKQKGPRETGQVEAVLTQVLSTLSFLHNLEPPVIHRDISPDNIVMRKDGGVAIIDFGAANEFMRGVTGTMVGKQSYIAPEQFRGKAEPTSDLYSLGATAYYLLTGEDPIPLSRSSLPQSADADTGNKEILNSFIERCTEFEPEKRFAGAEEALVFLSEGSSQ